MYIKPFGVEQWMNAYENDAKYNIAETCVDSLTIRELLELAGKSEGYWEELLDMRLSYGHIEGSEGLRRGIAGLFSEWTPDKILMSHGAIGANHLVFLAMVDPGDRVVSIMPTYQQMYSIPESLGADVKIIQLSYENSFLPDLEELRKLVQEKKPKMICLNNPNNPSGALIPDATLKNIVEIARSSDAWILCDEVYRHLNQSEGYASSIVDLYEKGISTGSMSKVFSLAGLRMGWIAAPREVLDACTLHRDYNTISCGMIDDCLAGLALQYKDKLLSRSLSIVRTNLAILDSWVAGQEHIHYIKPQAGTTALLYYDRPDISSWDFCVQLMQEAGVMLTPGSCFGLEKCVRVGYAADTQVLKDGLAKLGDFLKKQA